MLDKNIQLAGKTILVTEAAGFIGANLVLALLHRIPNVQIIGIDNMNSYYDVSLKKWRLKLLEQATKNMTDSSFEFVEGNIADKALINKLFSDYEPSVVVNLAA